MTLSTLALEFLQESAKHQFRSRLQAVGLFLMISVSVIGIRLLFQEWQLNADKRLLQDCPKETKDCRGRRKALENLVKAGKSLADFNLQSANLQSANLQSANLQSANLQSANLQSVYLESANLKNANLYRANLYRANLQRAKLESSDLFGAYLNSADLNSADLNSANFYSAYLNSANFYSAYLKFANFYSADLNSAYLKFANLYSAKLYSADLNSAYLENANLKYAFLINTKNLTPAQIKSACYWDQAFYKGYYDEEKRELIIDQEANKAYIEELKQDKASDPQTPPDCSKWE